MNKIITQEEIERAAEDYVSFEKGGKCYPSYIVERACCCAFKDGANFALGKQEKDVEETPITERLYEEEKSQLEWLYYYLNRAADKQENESVSVAILFEAMERLEDMFGVDLLTNGHGKTKPKDADTVIQGWAARDDNGKLYIYSDKPERNNKGRRWVLGYAFLPLSSDLFPDLTWDDEPQECEIIIKRKKK